MTHSFRVWHAVTVLLIVCLSSIVVGAVLAQQQPEIPEPVLPLMEVPAVVSEPDVPESPEIPVITVPPAVVSDAPADLIPQGIVTGLSITYDWRDVPDSDAYDFQLYSHDAVQLSPMTGEYELSPGALPAYEVTGLSISTLQMLSPTISDGVRYLWRVRGTDADGPGPWADAVFVTDVPRVYPEPGERILSTVPVISWLPVDNVQFFNVRAIVNPVSRPNDRQITWDTWYAADDIPSFVYGVEFDGVCQNDQCKVRPNIELVPITLAAQGDINISIEIRYYIPGAGNLPGIISNFQGLTNFVIGEPPAMTATVNGAGPGRPTFSVARYTGIAEKLDGLTYTEAPDLYRIVSYAPNSEVSIVDQWFRVSDCNDVQCGLTPISGVHKVHYNGDFSIYTRGYISEGSSYTLWGYDEPPTFSVNENNTPRPTTDDLRLLGIYESIGSDALQPDPTTSFNTWMQCEGLSNTATEPVCDSSRPILHFQPSVVNFSGERIHIIVFNRDDQTVVYNRWHNINEPVLNSPDGVFFQCSENTGALGAGSWQFAPLTCFFQPGFIPELGSMDQGDRHTYYLSSYAPGGPPTGGIAGLGYTEPGGEGDPNNIANFRVRGDNPPANTNVQLQAPDDLSSLIGVTMTLPVDVTYITGEPRFSWTEVPSASFYQLEVQNTSGEPMNVGGIVDGWFAIGDQLNDVRCEAGICGVSPSQDSNFFLLNTPGSSYRWRVRYWNGSLSEWSPFSSFAVNIGAPQAVDINTFTVYIDETINGTVTPRFRWQHEQNNTWYNIRVFDSNNEDVWETASGVPGVWFRAYDICVPAADGTVICDVRPELRFFLLEGDYSWTVTGFSPNRALAQSQRAVFTVSDTQTGFASPRWPASTISSSPVRTIDDDVKLALYFEQAPNASWYNILVIRRNADGTYAQPIVFDWFYLPKVGEYQYPEDALNRCGGTFNVDGQVFMGDNICRVIPTETNAQGEQVPLRVFENGTYEWYIRAFGPSGFNDGLTAAAATAAWRGPYTFRYDIPGAEAVDVTTITDLNGLTLDGAVLNELRGVQWQGVDSAWYYRVEFYDLSPDGTRGILRGDFGDTPEALGCGFGSGSTTCTLRFGPLSAIDFGVTGTYLVRVATWSPQNGFSLPINWSYPADGEQQYAVFVKL